MRYRRQDENHDMTFGHGDNDFLINNPECVAQSVYTRLLLFLGDWYADLSQGVPWRTQVVGYNTQPTYDIVIRSVILGTNGVTELIDYSSLLNRATRELTINGRIGTIFGGTDLNIPVSLQQYGFGLGPFGNTNFGS